MLFIYYPKCSTCQKAKKWLDAQEISYTERHIVEENPLATNGMLVKRPVIVDGDTVLTGFREKEWEEKLR